MRKINIFLIRKYKYSLFYNFLYIKIRISYISKNYLKSPQIIVQDCVEDLLIKY